LEQLEQGSESLNEARIILLGEMGAGKTSLALKLQDVNTVLSKNQESTVGVDLSLWNLKKNSLGEAINVHIWDFAGQTVMHSAHKFFLWERCVYIIVYDGRTEARNRLDYWLNLVKTYGGDSPVFILVNKHTDYSPDLNENGYKDGCPQIEGNFTYLSLMNDISAIRDFRNKIEAFIKNNSILNGDVPQTWFAVKEELNRMFSDSKSNSKKDFWGYRGFFLAKKLPLPLHRKHVNIPHFSWTDGQR
jgi:GTPase SAR1 family protein